MQYALALLACGFICQLRPMLPMLVDVRLVLFKMSLKNGHPQRTNKWISPWFSFYSLKKRPSKNLKKPKHDRAVGHDAGGELLPALPGLPGRGPAASARLRQRPAVARGGALRGGSAAGGPAGFARIGMGADSGRIGGGLGAVLGRGNTANGPKA